MSRALPEPRYECKCAKASYRAEQLRWWDASAHCNYDGEVLQDLRDINGPGWYCLPCLDERGASGGMLGSSLAEALAASGKPEAPTSVVALDELLDYKGEVLEVMKVTEGYVVKWRLAGESDAVVATDREKAVAGARNSLDLALNTGSQSRPLRYVIRGYLFEISPATGRKGFTATCYYGNEVEPIIATANDVANALELAKRRLFEALQLQL